MAETDPKPQPPSSPAEVAEAARKVDLARVFAAPKPEGRDRNGKR
jgi:hypothetical protein